ERADDRCEYCLVPQAFAWLAFEIDHVAAEKHGGLTDEANLAWACALCNGYKGTDLTSVDPLINAIERLFHPRLDRWALHFQFHSGRIEPLTATGRVTARLLQFNLAERIIERRLL